MGPVFFESEALCARLDSEGRPCSQLQQTMRARKVQGLRTTLHTQTTEQAPQVDFDGVFADIELFGDFTVA